jgi:hypothetical protein
LAGRRGDISIFNEAGELIDTKALDGDAVQLQKAA